MRLRIDVERYRRSLATPLATGSGALREREGLLVRLADDDARVGLGEAAPVYWMDDVSLAAVRDELMTLDGRVVEVDRLECIEDVHVAVATLTAMGSLRAAAHAALESAALDLAARRLNTAVAVLLGGSADMFVPVNALVSAIDPADVERDVRRHVAGGVRAIKLKVGACDPATDADRVRAASGAAGSGVRLRLDANRAWSLPVAEQVLAATSRAAIDYIEEPLAQPTLAQLARLRATAGVSIAIDESLSVLGGIASLTLAAACDVVVLKPARVGGPLRTLQLAADARQHGLRCVLTDSIETTTGRAAVVHSAAALGGEPEAIGLGGCGLIDDEPIRPWLRPCGPGLTVCCESNA